MSSLSRRSVRLLSPGAATVALAVATLLLGQALPSAAAPAAAPQTAPQTAPPRTETLAGAQAAAATLRTELADLRTRSAESIHRLEEAEDALAAAVSSSLQLSKRVDAARTEAEGTDGQLSRRVSALYRSGGTVGLWSTLLKARDPQDLVARKMNLDKVVAADAQLRDVAQDSSGELQDLEAQAREHAAATIAATAVAEDETAQLNALMARQTEALAAASERVKVIVEQERRAAAVQASRTLMLQQAEAVRLEAAQLAAAQAAARAAGTPVPQAASWRGSSGVGPAVGAYVGPPAFCPVGAAHSFTDTWHASRSGGRKHQGTDVFAPHGAPAYAVVDGVIDKVGNGGLGGITLWLRGDDGDRYYYAHNSANVARVGQRVRGGEVIAYVGKTGNAETTPPHIHFEAHPASGGGARNPAPWLSAICAS